MNTRQDTTRQPNAHTQLDRTAAQIFAANERMNQMLHRFDAMVEWLDETGSKPKALRYFVHDVVMR